MKSFSQRKGLKPVKNIIQVESMDNELRNALWNALFNCHWKHMKEVPYKDSNRVYEAILEIIWQKYFKSPLDTIPLYMKECLSHIRKYYFSCEWNEVYDFVEFIANFCQLSENNLAFIKIFNEVLESELSAYRFVGGQITQITSEEEISEIEEALESVKLLQPVTHHLKTALDYMSSRKSPDYRNSIKESISAVEAMSQYVTGDKKATLGKALKVIEEKVGLHPALKSAFNSLYGYTGDAEGIRHALMEESNLRFEDAKFMLVACSAFVNYLKAKTL